MILPQVVRNHKFINFLQDFRFLNLFIYGECLYTRHVFYVASPTDFILCLSVFLLFLTLYFKTFLTLFRKQLI